MVFLSDASINLNHPWQPHIDVQAIASRMRRYQNLGRAYLFVDACQELITPVLLDQADNAAGLGSTVGIFPPQQISDERNKVYVLVPGPLGSFAFDDGMGTGGRFTHILIEALSGAAACNYAGTGVWGVTTDDLHSKMKLLYGMKPEWAGERLDPTALSQLVDADPIIQFTTPPKIPICIRFEPAQAIDSAEKVHVLKTPPNAITTVDLNAVPAPRANICIAWPTAASGSHFVQADFSPLPLWPNSGKLTEIDISEMRVRPVIIHDVR
jgi:hypothetical protein